MPYPAGGPTDQLARILALKLSEKLGQNFIVENVSGGATTIATGRVAHAAPDGYMLLLHNLQISANVALYPKLPFDTEKDLAPIAFINHNPLVLVGRKSLRPTTLGELVAFMKTTPVKMAHPGTGSTGHLATPQSVVQQVSAGQVKAYGITAKKKLGAVPEGGELRRETRTQARDSVLARYVRTGRNAEADRRQAQRRGSGSDGRFGDRQILC